MPTPTELDQANRLYNDMNCYLDYLVGIIETEVRELADDEEEEDDDDYYSDDEELSPAVNQFLKDYKEYVSSSKSNADSDANSSMSNISSRLRRRFWRYSYQTLQLSPDIICDQKICETKLNRDVQVSPSFLSTLDNDTCDTGRLITNGASPSVALLKAQLEKHYAQERERNCIVIRQPKYHLPIEEDAKPLIFVVKKSTAVTVAPKQQESIKKEIEEKNSMIEDEKYEEVLSEKKTKKMNVDFLSSFLAITKVGFSRSQLTQLVWT